MPRRPRACTCLLLIAALAVAMWIYNVSRPGAQAGGCPEGCAQNTYRSAGPLRVMSLNVLHGLPRFERLRERLDLIAGEIGRQDPDIVCLQEVPWTLQLGSAAHYLAERTGLNYLYLRANGNRWAILFEEGEAILSRYALHDVDFAELQPRAGFFEHRMALGATAVTPWGEVRVFVTHLTNGDPEVNRAQADSLMTFVASGVHDLAIIAGDFNATEDSPQIQDIRRRAVDTYRMAHPEDGGPTCCVDSVFSPNDESLDERIDYLFLLAPPQHRATVASCDRVLDQPFWVSGGWLWASDHAGLLAAFCVNQLC